MDPLSLAGLSGLAAAGTAVAGIPDLVETDYEKARKRELEKLQKQQELGTLGLSTQERERLQAQLSQGARQSQQRADAERRRLLAGTSGVQPGQELLQAQMEDEAAARRVQQMQGQIETADIQEKQKQEQYIRDLEAAQAERERRRLEAQVAPFVAAGQTALGGLAPDRILGIDPLAGPAGVGQEVINNLMNTYGFTQEQAQQVANKLKARGNKEVLELFRILQ